MAVRPILLLGNPGLHRVCRPVLETELPFARTVADDLHDTLFDFRERFGIGRAVAAPQIGAFIRLVYLNIDGPVTFLNPEFEYLSDDQFVLWDECMSFPDILVRVERHQECRIRYRDLDWQEQTIFLQGDRAELLQHEIDHLDGILAVSRAVDAQSFAYRDELKRVEDAE